MFDPFPQSVSIDAKGLQFRTNDTLLYTKFHYDLNMWQVNAKLQESIKAIHTYDERQTHAHIHM